MSDEKLAEESVDEKIKEKNQEEETEIKKEKNKTETKKCSKFYSFAPLLTFLIFIIGYYLCYLWFSSDIALEVSEISNYKILEIFPKFSIHIGILTSIISGIIYLILSLIKKIFCKKNPSPMSPVLWIIAVLPWLLFARQMVFYEAHNTDIAKAIIIFISRPLYYSSWIVIWWAIIWELLIIKHIFKK